MACIDCRPICGKFSTSNVPSPVAQLVSAIGIISAILGVIGKLISIKDLGGPLIIVVLVLAAVLAGLAIIAAIAITAYDQCTEEPYAVTDSGIVKIKGTKECVTGVVNSVVSDFSSPFSLSWLLPWTANHDRIDVIVRSNYWEAVESNNADVICTDEEIPRRSEILRCYFFTERVCDAAKGALVGAVLAFIVIVVIAAIVVGGVALAVLAAAGCALTAIPTWGVGCWAVIVIAVIAFAALVGAVTLAGGIVGGLVVVATSQPSRASDDSGTAITVGDLITVHGKMLVREETVEFFDTLKVNIFWWVSSSLLQGKMSGLPPFSYCDVNDLFIRRFSTIDATGVVVIHEVNMDPCAISTNVMPKRCQ